jgi:hypothetical protein
MQESHLQQLNKIRKLRAPVWVTADTLNVRPDIIGMPLAKPARRAMAIALDLIVVALLSSTGALWIAAGMAATLFELVKQRAQAARRRKIWLWCGLLFFSLCATLALLALAEETPSPSPSIQAAGTTAMPVVAAQAETRRFDQTDADRIESLERQLEEARKPKLFNLRKQIEAWGNSIGLGFGWAIAYFSLLPFWWNGQTLGKKLLGLQVVELNGKPLRPMACLGRYGGYAAGMATGGIGFLQVLWDINRQGIQDKIAHTVVIDLRQPAKPAAPDERPGAAAKVV